MEFNVDDGSMQRPELPMKKRPIFAILGGLVVWPILFFAFSGAPACMGFEDPTLRAIEACPLAVQALGTPVARSWLGISCGSAESSDARGDASWTFPVSGSRGSGSVSVVAHQRGGPWVLQSASLEAGGRVIDVVTCREGGPLVIQAARYEATVTETIGEAGVAVGDRCAIALTPGEGSDPCRVIVTCGARVIYGAGTTGYAMCGVDAAGALTVRDTDPTPSGGDPTLDLRVATGDVVLTDQVASGTWVVTMHWAPEL